MAEIDNLRKYLTEAEPQVNRELRNASLFTFDGLFEDGNVPEFLYRLLPKEYVRIDENNIYCDAGYLSCTANADNFISHVFGQNIACLKIKLNSPTSRVVVKELIYDTNDEEEYILPRNLKLNCMQQQVFSGCDQFKLFVEQENLYISGREIEMNGIHSITLYDLCD